MTNAFAGHMQQHGTSITGAGLDEVQLLQLHDSDMFGAVEDPNQTPKAPTAGRDEPCCDSHGRLIDMQRDTPNLDDQILAAEPADAIDPLAEDEILNPNGGDLF